MPLKYSIACLRRDGRYAVPSQSVIRDEPVRVDPALERWYDTRNFQRRNNLALRPKAIDTIA